MSENEIPSNNWSFFLQGEYLIFNFLGKAFYNEPKLEWLQVLIDENLFSEVPFALEQEETRLALDLLQGWIRKYKNGITEEDFSDIKYDYARLFLGIDEILAAPWESVYFDRDKLVFREQTFQVREWYQKFGLELENLHKEPDDHIGLEMSFVSILAKNALEALDEKDNEKFKEVIDAKRQFLEEHLLRWGPYWCNLVKDNAKTDFYKGLSLLSRGALLALGQQYDVEYSKEYIR